MQPTPRDEQEPDQDYTSEATFARTPGTFLHALLFTIPASHSSVFDRYRKRPRLAASPEPKKYVP